MEKEQINEIKFRTDEGDVEISDEQRAFNLREIKKLHKTSKGLVK